MKKKQEKLDEFLTVRELAVWIKLSESHVYFLVNKNKIPFAKLGGKLLFEKEKIRKWIDSNSHTVEKEKKAKKPRVKKVVEKVDETFVAPLNPVDAEPVSEITEIKTPTDAVESGN